MRFRAPANMRPPDRREYVDSPVPIAAELDLLFPGRSARMVFDVGSCEGEDAVRYARFFPGAVVHAFEPVPENARLIEANVTRYGLSAIKVHELALADAVGRMQLYVSSGRPAGAAPSDWDYGNKSSSLLVPHRHLDVHPWVRFERAIEVSTDTIAHFCESEAIERIDLLHLDVQGAELRVLQGAGARIGSIAAVWMEVEAITLYKDQPLRPDVEAFMAERGFTLVASRIDAVSGDQLYCRPELVHGHLSSAPIRRIVSSDPHSTPESRARSALRSVRDRFARRRVRL